MYAVSAQVNDIAVVHVPLLVNQNFEVDTTKILETLSSDSAIKLVYLCSPGNPTGTLISKSAVQPILEHPTWNGIVVLDEAYIDFAPEGSSLAEWVTEWPNLVVMQTLSKAFGLAGIRLGAAFTDPAIAQLLNNLKAPYNISNPTSQIATAALQPQNLDVMQTHKRKILEQRDRLIEVLPRVPGIGNFKGGFTSNFLLVEILDKPREAGGKASNETALKVYESLAEEKGVVVRFRGKEPGCLGCLRITVGTKEEVDRFLKEIEGVLNGVYSAGKSVAEPNEGKKESAANDIVA
jgi:histidinol-phosphate aminotransferase